MPLKFTAHDVNVVRRFDAQRDTIARHPVDDDRDILSDDDSLSYFAAKY
jgi:hypothetical protein